MKKTFLSFVAIAGLAGAACAAPMTFDFKDPKGVNSVMFTLDAHLEAINGTATGVTGSITFDPENPGATTGTVTVASESMKAPVLMMTTVMHSGGWMDVSKYPEIKFVADKLDNVKTSGDTTTADAHGAFTLKGVSKELTVPVKLTYLPGKLGQRIPKMNGDLLVLRGHFTIKRSDFNVHAHEAEESVAEDIGISFSLAGAAPHS